MRTLPLLEQIARTFRARAHLTQPGIAQASRGTTNARWFFAGGTGAGEHGGGDTRLEKALGSHAPCGCLLGTLLGKKFCDINKPLGTF